MSKRKYGDGLIDKIVEGWNSYKDVVNKLNKGIPTNYHHPNPEGEISEEPIEWDTSVTPHMPKRSRLEAATENLEADFGADQLKHGPLDSTGLGDPSAISNAGGIKVLGKRYNFLGLNWKRVADPQYQILDLLSPKIRWTEILGATDASRAASTNKRGIIMSSEAGHQMVNDGQYRLKITSEGAPWSQNGTAAITNNQIDYYDGFGYLTTFSYQELDMKFKKCSVALNPMGLISGTYPADTPTQPNNTYSGSMHIRNFEKEYIFTNTQTNSVWVEIWDMLCIEDTDKGPLWFWAVDQSSQNTQDPIWANNTDDNSSAATPYVNYRANIATPGMRPDKFDKNFHTKWKCLRKDKYLLPPGTTIKWFIKGDFTISGQKLYRKYDSQPSQSFLYLAHCTRMPLIFTCGQPGIIQTNTNTPPNIGGFAPSAAKWLCQLAQGATYRSIPIYKSFYEIYTNWYNNTTQVATGSLDPTAYSGLTNAQVRLAITADNLETGGPALDLLMP